MSDTFKAIKAGLKNAILYAKIQRIIAMSTDRQGRLLKEDYDVDPRWEEVYKFIEEGEKEEACNLARSIDLSWGNTDH